MEKLPSPADRKAPMPAFDPIEAALREIFDGIESEPVPDDFAALIAKLGKIRTGDA